ncbi:MAG: adenylyltransferase/cytidyltransferase family protein [Anaerolineales bacterium]
MPEVCVSAAFNDLRSRDVRYLQEAARLGDLTVYLWSDKAFQALEGRLPEFPEAERLYMLNAIRYVKRVELVDEPFEHAAGGRPDLWVVDAAGDAPAQRHFCASQGIGYRVIPEAQLQGFPPPAQEVPGPVRPKVIVTGCYDWLHSGHIRFFEQASAYGDLYVSLGNDANIRQLKGAGHPLLSQDERAYMVGAIRFVTKAFVAAGFGWLDAATEIEQIRPDIYLVNQDGDRPEKRAFCRTHGLQYEVLQRLPKEGLPSRQSTQLRGY